ncbi:MAG: hypothetical protein JSS94_05095 [Bacteroidetes bacterium]|nr:hypothetical protein [Bacteroidota bacterium]
MIEKRWQFFLMISSLVIIVIRFLLNEKGRVSPDSIRYMRTAHVFPEIDNTTTPLGYPLAIKFFTFFGIQEFWSSKLIGILAFLFLLYFAWYKKFYFKEMILTLGLISFVSIFSFTLSETLIIPFVFIFLYVGRNSIIGVYTTKQSFIWLSICLLMLYNIRYSALFFMVATLLYGLWHWKKYFGKSFVGAALVGFLYVILYKILFIDAFNSQYIQQFLETGLHPFSSLLKELFYGLTTSFNPLIHMANPSGGPINMFIYGIGFFTIVVMLFLFLKFPISPTENFLLFVGGIGIVCSFFIQLVYSVDALDYRLLSPFIFSIWLVFFKKIYAILGRKTYAITAMSLLSCFVFTWLSRGNYLENRKEMTDFLKKENLLNGKIYFYTEANETVPEQIQMAEIISTINPWVYITHLPKDTLDAKVLTMSKVKKRTKIIKNKYQ